MPKTERNAPRVIVMEPKGLQIIDELIFSEQPVEEASEIVKQTKHLSDQTLLIKNYQQHGQIYDRQILEAVRLGLVRIMALGLTQFDTPASGYALEENIVAFTSLHRTLQPYLKSNDDARLATEINQLFEAGKKQLAQTASIDEFNHALFIREYINPLYKRLKELHLALKIETVDEVVDGEVSINYAADHIFSDQFLDPYYYTVLYKELDNAKLRELGQKLFFDPILSKSIKRSCASCHIPEKGFTDGLATSKSLKEGQNIKRNAPTILNSIYSEKFFYDLRADKMENQMEHVIFNEHEFASNYKTIFNRLEQSEEYKRLFAEAFADAPVSGLNRYTFSAAISSYVLSLHSFNSPVDRYLRGENIELSQEVVDGMNLFMGKASCATCHFAPTFAGLVPPLYQENETEVLGVFESPTDTIVDDDLGRLASGRLADEAAFYKHSFKTPTVRNVALTAPYFHNGSYQTLEQVVDFYNQGGALGHGLALANQTLPPDALMLSADEKKALIAFMEALTDTSGLNHRPASLPAFTNEAWNARKIGGEY